jgi:hypothetical protein
MIDLIKLKILIAYLRWLPISYSKMFYLWLLRNVLFKLPDKAFILSADKNCVIKNVTREYIYHHPEITIRSGAFYVPWEAAYDEVIVETCTYQFIHLYNLINDDKSILLNDIKTHLDFNKLIIDYEGPDHQLVKKIITYDKDTNTYHNNNLEMNNSTPIPFGRLAF